MDDERPLREAAFRLAIPHPPIGERRVPLDPETVSRLSRQGWAITIEQGAGEFAGFPDAAFEAAGASIVADRDYLRDVDVLLIATLPNDPCLTVTVPAADHLVSQSQNAGWTDLLHRVPTIIGLLNPLDHLDDVQRWSEGGQTAFSLDIMPQASRALLADATASQGSLAGYRGALLAVAALDRTVPLLVLPAGSLPPARFLIVGSDPVGLQAAITAHRLGAIVEFYDPRASERETVESIGATFIGGDIIAESGERPSRAEAARRQQQLLADHARHADAIILAAVTPGRPAPKLISQQTVEAMRPGSVIVDLAAPWGGNCALTRPGEEIIHHNVAILGPLNPAADLAHQASTLLAHNVEYFLTLLAASGTLPMRVEEADPVVQAACVVDHGEVHYRPARSRLGLAPLSAAPAETVAERLSEEPASASAFAGSSESAESTPDKRRSGRRFRSMTWFGRPQEEAPSKPRPAPTSAASVEPTRSDEGSLAPGLGSPEIGEPVHTREAAPADSTSAAAMAGREPLIAADREDHDPVLADAEHAEEAQRQETLAWASESVPDITMPRPADDEQETMLAPPAAESVPPAQGERSTSAPAAPAETELSEAPEPIPLSAPEIRSTTGAASGETSDTSRADEGLGVETATPAPPEESRIEPSPNDQPVPAEIASPSAFVPERDDATGTYEPMPSDDVIDDQIPSLPESPTTAAPESSQSPGVPTSERWSPSERLSRPPGWGEWSTVAPPVRDSAGQPPESHPISAPADDSASTSGNPSEVSALASHTGWPPFGPQSLAEEDLAESAADDTADARPSITPVPPSTMAPSAAAPEASPPPADQSEPSENTKALRWRPWRRSPPDQDRH